jgi:nucleotide-binding universal stress UspA family protein
MWSCSPAREAIPMFRSILVPLDGTPDSAAALPLARSIAETTSATVHLLTITPSAPHTSDDGARGYLDLIAHQLKGAGLRADFAVRSGDPAAEIVKYGRLLGVDLIVMATRAVGDRSILALTSVARQVVMESISPVLLLRPGSKSASRMRTLLVPIDGSPGGSLALAAARALAHAAASRIVLVQVVVPVPAQAFAALPGMTVGGYIDPEWEDLARTCAHMHVQGVASRLKQVGLECETRVATGDVGAEILRCAEEVDADIVVMSTHSAAWPARAYLSSVADRVLREGNRPVLLVRREPPAGEAGSDSPGIVTHAGAYQRVFATSCFFAAGQTSSSCGLMACPP